MVLYLSVTLSLCLSVSVVVSASVCLSVCLRLCPCLCPSLCDVLLFVLPGLACYGCVLFVDDSRNVLMNLSHIRLMGIVDLRLSVSSGWC